MHKILPLVFLALAPLAVAAPAEPLKLEDIRIHDPWILPHAPSGEYFLYTSSREGGRSGVKAYRSRDLRHWTGPQQVFEVPDGVWADPRHGAWAPEVHEWNGKFHLFVTLHNNDEILARPPDVWRPVHLRGTVIATADSPEGPFRLVKPDGPHPPRGFMTLDGTLYKDPAGQPWMVYCHEWIQKIDGTVEAIRLSDDLSATRGEPLHLFKGSDAPWLNAAITPDARPLNYVTDGCQLYRLRDGSLVMLWASYRNGRYVQTQARSTTGELAGPWQQLDPLVDGDSGHGMIFKTFEGDSMLVVHRPFGKPTTRAKLYDVEDAGDRFRIVRPRGDLDGDGRAAIVGE